MFEKNLKQYYINNIYAIYGKNTKQDYEKALADLRKYCIEHNYSGLVYEFDFLLGDEELARLYLEFCDKKSAYSNVKNKLDNFYIDEPTLPDKPLSVKQRPPYALALAGAAVGVVISVLYAFWIYKKRFGFK